jgi:hypothetical protein
MPYINQSTFRLLKFKCRNERLTSQNGGSNAEGGRHYFSCYALWNALSSVIFFTRVSYLVPSIEVVSPYCMSAVTWSSYEEQSALRFMAPCIACNIAFPTFSTEREVKQLISTVLSNKKLRKKLRSNFLPIGRRTQYPFLLYCSVGRDSSVGVATRYGLDGSGIESR